MREEFWDFVCGNPALWQVAFTISVVLLVLLAVSLALVEPDSASYYVSMLNVALVVPLVAVSGYMLRRCRSREF
ncbi:MULTISPECIES: hypothetical protein [unclassified Haladaptatus]|uniref:hypothetical protein n=1 Tax=unclassified Haladaptatus TaxID=2622732 RepID=UPI0023E881E1|nr:MULTISPECIES: hypothetical protein [unclassified Haladaptatus]